ncbi:MAG TPA: DHA2 family efflux MFS transporter permease subunit [Gemmatimonadales bacterium]|nr:DHA2 family efflux MFS transporter permease subunit [Gemmatimonadales bacterium]
MPHHPNKWVVAGTVLIGTIMAVLDSSVVNVALPDMSGTLGATIEEITWVVTAYILAQVIFMPITALLSSRFGRKNFYVASVILFTAASMACGLARTMPVMILFRAIQGAGGGVMITVSQAILRESFPPEEQGTAMGLFGVGTVLAPAIGPTLGGWLTDQYSWPWVFYVNVPIGALAILLVTRFVEDPPYLVREKGRIDWAGLGAMTIGLGAFQLMLEKGQDKDWFQSSFILWLGVLSVVFLVAFIWRELKTERPAVDLSLFRNVPFTSATALGGVLGMGLYGALFLLPLFLQELLGYPAMKSGLALMPRSLAMAVVMPIGGLLYNRLGPRVLVGTGLAISAYSFWDLAHLTTDTGIWDLLLPQVWQGVGFGMLFVALSTAALSAIPKARMTAASGLYNVVRQVLGSVGIAVAATELVRSQSRYHDVLAEHVTPYGSATQSWLHSATAGMISAGADVVTATGRAVRLLDFRVMRQAIALAYNHVLLLVAALFVISLPLVLLVRGHRDTKVEMAAE